MFRLQDIILLGVVFCAFGVGILFPGVGAPFEPFILYFMMTLLFLSFLTIHPGEVRRLFHRQGRAVLWLSFLKLIALPVGIYLLFRLILPAYAPSALLLAGVSAGVVAPFMATLLAANAALVLVLVVVTSLALPFTLPLLVKMLLGATMELSLPVMIRMLALIVFIPLAAVQGVKRFFPMAVRPLLKVRYALSLMIMAATNMGVSSQYSAFFYRNPGTILEATAVSVLLGALFLLLGFLSLGKAPVEDRLAAAISMTQVNNMIILVFGARFFGPLEATMAAMYLVPFFGLILPLRMVSRRREGKAKGP
jgi:BASS family bile acid:Na+ symporter